MQTYPNPITSAFIPDCVLPVFAALDDYEQGDYCEVCQYCGTITLFGDKVVIIGYGCHGCNGDGGDD